MEKGEIISGTEATESGEVADVDVIEGKAPKRPSAAALIASLIIIIALIAAGRYISEPAHISFVTDSLDETKGNVEKLAAAATAGSAAITLLPGDIATPIAEKLADLSFYFLWILAAVYIEKALVAVTGFLIMQIILPAGVFLRGIVGGFSYKWAEIGKRIIAIGIVLAALVPISVGVSEAIQNQYDYSVQATVDAAVDDAQTIQGTADQADDENSNVWSKFIDKIEGGSQALLHKLETLLNNFIEAVAVYLVTSCVVPVLTFIIGIKTIQWIFGIQGSIGIDRLPKGSDIQRAASARIKGQKKLEEK